MKLIEQLTEYVRAAFTGIWVHTHEADEAEREIFHHARQEHWKIAVWDVAGGMRLANSVAPAETGGDPLAALRTLPGLAELNGTVLLLMHNLHKFLGNPEVIQSIITQLIAGKQQRLFLVVLSPVVQIPIELEKLFVVLDHALPDRAALERIAVEMTTDHPDDLPKGEALDRVLDAAAGLTRYEAEGALALSLVRHNMIRPEVIWELKAQALKKNNLLSLKRSGEKFEALGGLTNLKDFCRRALQGGKPVKPRGILLLGVPGTGKSAFCQALGNETARPTLTLDLGALLGSLVGATEQNIRQALRIADAMSPCVLFCDELEKALSGIGSQGDSGVSTRLFGTLLTWLSDRESDVFFVATSNDISKLPPEFTRAERFDGVFFLDLPDAKEKDAIWAKYRREFQLPAGQSRPEDTDWTGAEIKSCCRLAALLGVTLTQAAAHVVPVAITAAESMEKLRQWASGRCLSASMPGIYRRPGSAGPRVGRRVQRDPSNN